MEKFIEIWNFLVKSNTFNFVIMIVLLGWLVKKASLGSLMEKLKNDVINTIEKSKQEKETAIIDLTKAKKAVENLDTEISTRLESAAKHAEDVSKGILEDAEAKVKNITENIKKAVETEEKTISSKLTSKTVKASVELAKKHIKEVLKNNPELHEKYINESIEDLDRITI